MLEQHDLLASFIQYLNMSICTGNDNTGVPSIIGGKCSIEKDESIDSSSKSLSFNKHSVSLIAVAKIAAVQQEKDCSQAHVDSILSRIDSFLDMKRNLVIWLDSTEASKNKSIT